MVKTINPSKPKHANLHTPHPLPVARLPITESVETSVSSGSYSAERRITGLLQQAKPREGFSTIGPTTLKREDAKECS